MKYLKRIMVYGLLSIPMIPIVILFVSLYISYVIVNWCMEVGLE